ncbi:flippase activity-associated protein Agl23 [Halobellus captivus]|uniref:flippase activity-associated protein Agl23 n=1 Tax=Halobellus captivus TaxID=2592614 RepID=UPI0011AA3930|nr:flippase activity-associated protein Agl23 [Halobellus captivus]
MSREGDVESEGSERRRAPFAAASVGRDPVVVAVFALSLVGLALRVIRLGERPFHWDEARVGYWTLRYLETGAYQYRPVAGGPLLYLLDRTLFDVVGVSERVARLPVALLGSGLPLVALLFRDRLDDAETVLFAALLAVHPFLLYYSRFLRGDVPLALFGLAFVGFAVRAWDRGSRRDAYAAAVALPLAASASGFVAGYLLCWLLAWALVIDQRSVAADRGSSARATLAELRTRLSGSATPAARAGLLATGVTAFLFAPRSGPGVDVGLYDPATVHLALYAGTVGAVRQFVGVRIVHRGPDGVHAFIPHLGDAVRLLVSLALPVLVLGVGTALWARYGTSRRPLVEGVGYWGLAAIVVFPTVSEVSAPWTLVHVIAPMCLPAAVGLVAVVRRGFAAASVAGDDAPLSTPDVDAGTVVALVLVVVAVAAQMGAVAAAGVYGPSDRSNELAQFAQPADDLEPLAAAAGNVADDDPSTIEVLYVGSAYYIPNERTTLSPPVGDAWGNRLPLPWYFESTGADAASTENVTTFDAAYGTESVPPIVVADPDHRAALSERLGAEYNASTYRLGLWNREVTVFVRERVAG